MRNSLNRIKEVSKLASPTLCCKKKDGIKKDDMKSISCYMEKSIYLVSLGNVTFNYGADKSLIFDEVKGMKKNIARILFSRTFQIFINFSIL